MKQYHHIIEKLNLSEEELHACFESLGGTGRWIYLPDTNEYWLSDQLIQLFQFESLQSFDKKLLLSKVHPEDLEEVIDEIRKLRKQKGYHLVHRILVKDKVKWVEQQTRFFEKTSGISFLLGCIWEIEPFRKNISLGLEDQADFTVISNYLSETNDLTDLNGLLPKMKKAIENRINIATIALFMKKKDGQLFCSFPRELPFRQMFFMKNDWEYLAYHAIETGEISYSSVEEYSDPSCRQILKELGTEGLYSFPVFSDAKPIGALSVALKSRLSCSAKEISFLQNFCRYLAPQLSNIIQYQQLKQQLAERARLESDIDMIFSEMPDFIGLLDEQGNFMRMNPPFANRLGCHSDPFYQYCLFDFIYEQDRLEFQKAFFTLPQKGVISSFVCRYLCKDATVGYLESNLKYIKNSGFVVMVSRDITQQKEIEKRNAELEKSIEMEKLKCKFFSNLSHELQTPLNTILSSLDLMRMKLAREKHTEFILSYEKLLNYAYQNSCKLLRLTTNLLDSSELDSRCVSLHLSEQFLQDVIREVVASADPYVTARGIFLDFQAKTIGGCSIYCDADKIGRILLNLISNSIRHTEFGGYILVTLREDQDYAKITVADNGSGIAEEQLPHIFEKFSNQREGLISKYQSDGPGMGLYLVKNLVEMHSGTVAAKSELGKGTEITFTISKHLQGEAASVGSNCDYSANVQGSMTQIELSNLT